MEWNHLKPVVSNRSFSSVLSSPHMNLLFPKPYLMSSMLHYKKPQFVLWSSMQELSPPLSVIANYRLPFHRFRCWTSGRHRLWETHNSFGMSPIRPNMQLRYTENYCIPWAILIQTFEITSLCQCTNRRDYTDSLLPYPSTKSSF